MDILRLLLALALPWIGSYCWLSATEARLHGRPAHPLRQIGYAYFFGLMVVFGLLMAQSRLTGGVAYWPIMGLLVVYTVAGAAFRWLTPVPPFPKAEDASRLSRFLFPLLVGLVVIHLALVAIEIWYRPIFPWDAWQTWMYRSKAWFFEGNIAPLDSAISWEHGLESARYNTYGANYPAFVSVIALWSALALGYWSDTLVNLPTLFCGIAIALGLYGHCREADLSRWVSILAAYLLLSIPLLGTHLALAGQADIWQAAFTGLGLTALILGIISDEVKYRLLGLATVLAGALVKNEGLVWFIAAVAILLISYRARLVLIATSALLGIAGLAWLSGVHYVELPILGGLGVADGYIHIPFLGRQEIMVFSLWDDYRANFFESSTWNMLWWLVVICAISLPLLPRGPVRWAALSLLLVLVMTQAGIFAFTAQGRWAEDWTAINRLPLHMVPALIFCLLLCARQLTAAKQDSPTSKLTWVAPAMGLVVCIVLAGTYLAARYPTTEGTPREYAASSLGIVAGGGYIQGDVGVINRFEGNIAVVSNRQFRVDASNLKMLRVNTGGDNRAERRFFWRNGSRPEDLHSIDIGEAGSKLVHLGASENWKGKASEVGLLFYEDENRPVEVYSLSLHPRTNQDLLDLTWQDWTTMTDWNLKSVHYAPAGAESSPLKLPVVMAGWMLGTIAMALLLVRWGAAPGHAMLACAMLVWLVVDLRWTTDRWDQSLKTRAYYMEHSRDHLDIATDIELADFAKAAMKKLDDASAPVLVLSEEGGLDFEALRIKYHLLPTPAHYKKGSSLTAVSSLQKDTIIVVRSPYQPPGEVRVQAAELARRLGAHFGQTYGVLLDTENGVLLVAES